MKKQKIIILFLLCFALILLSFSCSGDNGEADNPMIDGENAAFDGVSEDDISIEADLDTPDLPDVDMDGKIFTILTAGWWGSEGWNSDVAPEEYNGEPVDDAGYERRIKIEQMYNVIINQIEEPSHSDAVNKYRTSILAGDGAYDAAITTCSDFASLLAGNYLTDFKELTYVDMDKPYWSRSFYDAMSIMGNHFGADGDISVRRLKCTFIMAFNKSMIKDNGLESPYDLVKNGQWTFDKMIEMSKQIVRDLNGDGSMTRGDDVWGINYTSDTLMGIINSVGINLVETDSAGIPQLTAGTERNLSRLLRVYEDIVDESHSVNTLFSAGGATTGLADTDIFADNRNLFLAGASHLVPLLREIELDFGIIPYPKWDAAQEQYIASTAGNYHPVLSVPMTNTDLDNTSIILEAMAYEGRKTIRPLFYENLLKTKTARDEESAEIIDYIFSNIIYDKGNMYNFGEMLGTFGYTMSTNMNANIVSLIESNTPVWQGAIDNLINATE